MPQPRVFISHSAREDARALALLQSLDTRLRAEGFEVFLDRTRLEVGDSWEYKIGTWLDRCHAAIVLFTTKALNSDYVKFEVSNLLHRWQFAGGAAGSFPLLPVLVEALSEEQLKGFYTVVNLWAVQRIGPDNDGAIAKTVVDKLTPLKLTAASFDQRLAGHVARILDKVGDDDFLTDVAKSVGIDTAKWPAQKVAPLMADALISSRTPDAWQAIRLLQPRLIAAALVRNLFDLLMPCWVGPESARALEAVTQAAPGSRCGLVNAQAARFTPSMYLARAKAQRASLAGTIVPVRIDDLGTNLTAGFKARVIEQLEALLGVNDPDLEIPTTIVQQLALRPTDDPVVVAVKVDQHSLPVVAAVAQEPEFARATFLALTAASVPDTDPPNVKILRPPLPAELEAAAYQQYPAGRSEAEGDMTQTEDVLTRHFRAPENPAYDKLGSSLGDRRDGQVYVHDPALGLAVRVAIATGRPLLLRGPAGSGKSSLAPFVARMYERRFYKATVTARTEARDLMWNFDALKRLNDAQIIRTSDAPDTSRVHQIEHYIEPRALWWAFDSTSAARRGVAAEGGASIEPAADPGIGLRINGVVVLIDEIDKADPDVPNNLLESLGSLQFTVAETGFEVRASPGAVPLVIITTNDERELPPAFYRRCVVHVLGEHKKPRLVQIAEEHFRGQQKIGGTAATTLYESIADQVERYRTEAAKRRERPPSTAEYLDAVRACLELGIDTNHADWDDVARLALTKRAPEPAA